MSDETTPIVEEPKTEDECTTSGCPDCEKRAHEARQAEELALAFLVALMPLMTITLFGNMGLI